MFRSTPVVLALMMTLLGASEALSDFVLQFGQSGVVGANSFSGSVGQTIVAEVYLTQTGGETRLSSSSTGLVSADFTVTIDRTSVAPVSTSFGPGFVEDGTFNTGVSPSSARISEVEAGQTGQVGVTTAVDGTNDNSVLLGTVSLQIAPGANGTYQLSVAQDNASAFGAFSLADPGFPQSISVTSGSGTLTISAVPEPSTLALFGLAAAAAIGRASKSRRQGA